MPTGSSYQVAKIKLDKAQSALMSWDRALNDPKKFHPVIKREWDRAFDARERANEAACRADPDQFISDYPSSAWLAVYFGLRAA